ncbi:MAG: DUF4115 domain-containing protein [Candidatus Omnitrophica bacterium]|nr:DUF4115 domain-containing protein [Candidatus Omnitrophota bacterium]
MKTTRQAKGLTLEIVHEHTKIPMDALKAIEEGYSLRLLSPFYYRGFIKIYAEFLGLNVAEIFQQYGINEASKSNPSSPASLKPHQSNRKAKTLEPNAFIEHLQEFLSMVFAPKSIKLMLKILGGLLLCFLLFKMVMGLGSLIHKKSAPVHKQIIPRRYVKPVEKNEDETPVEKPVRQPVVPVVKQEPVEAQSENNKVEVAVRAMRNTWVQVKADGKIVYQMTLNKGALDSWSADDRIELSGKNLEQLDMEINGKHIGPLGGGERRIRKVLVTKEGLTVKK